MWFEYLEMFEIGFVFCGSFENDVSGLQAKLHKQSIRCKNIHAFGAKRE